MVQATQSDINGLRHSQTVSTTVLGVAIALAAAIVMFMAGYGVYQNDRLDDDIKVLSGVVAEAKTDTAVLRAEVGHLRDEMAEVKRLVIGVQETATAIRASTEATAKIQSFVGHWPPFESWVEMNTTWGEVPPALVEDTLVLNDRLSAEGFQVYYWLTPRQTSVEGPAPVE